MPLIVEFRGDAKQFERVLDKSVKSGVTKVKFMEKSSVASATKMTSAFGKFNKILGPLGIGAGIGGLTIAFKKLLGSMTGFETALAEVSTLVDTTRVDMSLLSDEIINLSTKVPRTAIDLSKGLYQTISAGVTDASESMKLLTIASKAAVGGITDTNTAVDAITTVMNSYGQSVDEANNISDTFFTTIREGKTTFPELAQGIGTVSSSAALAGVSFDELGASIATITKGGIDTMTTVTALNRLFLTIAAPTDKIRKTTNALGIEFSAAALRSKGFAQFMKELTAALEKDENAIFELGLDMRAFRALAILGGTGAEEFSRQIENMTNKGGAAESAFEKLNDTTNSNWQITKNRLNKAWLETSGIVLPILNTGLTGVNFVLENLGTTSGIMADKYEEMDRAQKAAAISANELATGGNALVTMFRNIAMAQAEKNAADAEAKKLAEEAIQKQLEALEKFAAIGKVRGDLTTVTQRVAENQERIAKASENALKGATAITPELKEQADVSNELNVSLDLSVSSWDKINLKVNEFATGMAAARQQMAVFFDLANQALDIFEQLKRSAGGFLGTVLGGIAGFFIGGGPAGIIPGAQAGGQLAGRLGFQGGGSFTVPGSGGGDRPIFINAAPGERVDITPRSETEGSRGQAAKVEYHLHFPNANRVDEQFILMEVAPVLHAGIQRGDIRSLA